MAKTTPAEGVKKHINWDARIDGAATPISMPGWPKGMNNILPSESLERDTLRNAVNVDVDDAGKVSLRQGYSKVYDGSSGQVHSLWSCTRVALVVDGPLLCRVEEDLSLTTVLTGLPLFKPVTFLELHDSVYFSNGETTGIYDLVSGTVRPWGVEVPSQPLPGVTAGSLIEGRYSVCLTYSSDYEEGGASRSAVLDVSSDSGLSVTLPTAFPAGVVAANIYVSAPNGTLEYHYGRYTTPGAVVPITHVPVNSRECSTKLLAPPPAGTALMYYKGSIYVAKDKVVYHTEPMRYGAIRLGQNFMMFPSEVRLLAATREQDGYYVSDKHEHYFVSKDGLSFVAPYPAIEGMLIRDELTDDPVWFTTKGWVVGKAEGVLEVAMASAVAVPEYERGAVLYRERDSLRQYVSSFPPSPESNQFSATDYIEAEVIRKGA